MSYKVILIRHGESLANVDPSYYFGPEKAIILTERGVRQALALSKKIDWLLEMCGPATKIISSKYIRAMLTADIACDHLDHEIHRDERLNECPYLIYGSSKQKYESSVDVRRRVKACFDEHQDTSLIVFCHGEVMWNLDPDKPQVENTEYRIYNRDEFYEKNLNLIDHLPRIALVK